jgi:hypothetical protein
MQHDPKPQKEEDWSLRRTKERINPEELGMTPPLSRLLKDKRRENHLLQRHLVMDMSIHFLLQRPWWIIGAQWGHVWQLWKARDTKRMVAP